MHVTFPLLANLYLLCTLLSTLWTIGDFTTVYLVSGGGPAGSTDVLATLGFHYAFDASKPALGVAAVTSAPGADPDCDRIDAQAPDERGRAVSVATALPQAVGRRYRLRRVLTEAGSVMLGAAILIWSLAPVYNMFLIALDPEEGEIEFDGNL